MLSDFHIHSLGKSIHNRPSSIHSRAMALMSIQIAIYLHFAANIMAHEAQKGFCVPLAGVLRPSDSSLESSGSSSSSPYSISLIKVSGTASDFVLFEILLLLGSSTSGEAENLGGGGGGMALGGGGGIPLDNGLNNFFGGGIVDTFLKARSSTSSLAFKGSNPCNELEEEQESQTRFLNKK